MPTKAAAAEEIKAGAGFKPARPENRARATLHKRSPSSPQRSKPRACLLCASKTRRRRDGRVGAGLPRQDNEHGGIKPPLCRGKAKWRPKAAATSPPRRRRNDPGLGMRQAEVGAAKGHELTL